MIDPWDERYATDEYVYGTEPNDLLRQYVTSLPQAGRVLCVADGEGRNGVFLAEQGMHVVSMDRSTVGLQKAEALAAQRGVSITTVAADLAQADLGHASWDAIVSIFCHLPQDIREDLHRRVVDALKPGGVFILEAYTPDQIPLRTGGPPTPDMMVTADALRRELQGLDLELCREVTRDIHEGRLHHGISAVVQCVAKKPAATSPTN
ncbi:MAG: class I SAM-dependent methyltransferase [Candidatus Kapabacteria bacterium]|nr:class I SAM-dependent methyltransferase [Candidatus Kapabacteria bacterium]